MFFPEADLRRIKDLGSILVLGSQYTWIRNLTPGESSSSGFLADKVRQTGKRVLPRRG